jgi:hypothetical protein
MNFCRKGLDANAAARFVIARLLVMMTLCLLPVTAHAVEFKAEGAVGDRGDRDVCGAGEFMVGVRFRAGSWLDQVQIKCAILDPATGTLGSANSRGQPRGGIGGVGGSAHCPDDMWMTQIGFWFTGGNRQVRHVGVRCEFPAPNGRPEQFFTFGQGGPVGTGNPRHVCPPGEAAVGFNTRSGQHVNALGLICARTPALGKALRRVHDNLDLPGNDLTSLILTSMNNCEINCNRNKACVAWTWVKPGFQGPSGRCYLKSAVPKQFTNRCCTSGFKAQ